MGNYSKLLLMLSMVALLASQIFSLPLSASNRWIVDSRTGQRVKLLCANWPSHMSVMLAEGLDKQPIRHIIFQLHHLGLNCVRLTWATHMFTRYSNNTLHQTLDSLNLTDAKAGITKNNPILLTMTHPQTYAFVVDQLAAQNIMVLSDNHISEPKWCCSPVDGNAFFGDTNFDPKEWLLGLYKAAQLLKTKPNVVAMSLRNELRGPLQNVDAWYGNMTLGAQTVHQENPNVVIIISGFFNDNDLSFLKNKPLNVTFKDKVAYEVHSYTMSGEHKDWSQQSANHLCGKVNNELNSHATFLTTGLDPAPLLLTEYGISLSPRAEADERWLTCILAYLAVNDLGWGWWGLQGSYYLREGNVNPGESYGLLDFQWRKLSYPEFPHRFQLVLKTLQDPSSKKAMSNIMYHPRSGLCVKSRRKHGNQVEVHECNRVSGWSVEGTQIKLLNSKKAKCLKAIGEGKPVELTTDCSKTNQTSWTAIAESGMHWAAMDAQGNTLCLQKDANSSTILTAKCICADLNPSCMNNPQSQWFQFVPTNVM